MPSLSRRTLTISIALLCLNSMGLIADDTAPTKANPPAWVTRGAYVYRISTPDQKIIPQAEAGLQMTSNLLDRTVTQIPIMNGVLGHDHTGALNWDGLWPFWGRPSFRVNQSWKDLSDFMAWSRDNANTLVSFHVNFTDVNVGLRDYPESRDFFKKLVDTKSIYRRDWDAKANTRNGPPFVPLDLDKYVFSTPDRPDPNLTGGKDPESFSTLALVNYGNFWNSGLAKEMIDGLYTHLPYPPPVLYTDVLTPDGGNFNPGPPDGPLGGSDATQIKGMQDIADYLHSKGTDIGTEGDRPFLGINAKGEQRAGYVWLHGDFSNDDYSVIRGAMDYGLYHQHVYGSPGGFNVSPIALTDAKIAQDKEHYAALLAGKPGTKPVATDKTYHIAIKVDVKDEYDIPGTGDQFRGDWVDLVNNFYMATIQELYHIGNKAVRQRSEGVGSVHIGKYVVTAPSGDISVSLPEFFVGWQKESFEKIGEVVLFCPVETKVTVPSAGSYPLKFNYKCEGGPTHPFMNIYVNGVFYKTFSTFTPSMEFVVCDAGSVQLNQGENTIAFDPGPVSAKWSDGTVAEWKTPYLLKGFKVTNGDITLAEDYDRMWPDTWSGQKKIYFFSWDGTTRSWKLPLEWRALKSVTLFPLTPDGRGKGQDLPVTDGSIMPKLLSQIPYIVTGL